MIFAFAGILASCNSNKSGANLQATRDSIKKAVSDSLKLDSLQKAEAKARAKAQEDSIARVAAERRLASSRRSYSSGHSVHPVVQGESYEETQPRKKGWSSAAKGAVIGAGAGTATGLIIDHKNAKGAIIGGVLGAGTGYIIGHQHDKKTGRAQ